MKSDNKNLIVVLAVILVISFFLPWLKFFVSINAWDMVFGDVGEMIDSPVRYLAIIIPVSSLLIIYAAAFKNEKYPISKTLLFALPLITLIVIGVIIFTKVGENGNGGEIGNADFGDLMKLLGIGFWLTLIASIILPVIGKGSKTVATAQPVPIPPAEKQNFENPNPVAPPKETVPIPENKIVSPKVNDPSTNLQSMAKQKKFVLIGAALGIISTFLTWVSFSVSLFGYTQHVQSYNGMHGTGVLAFFCFIISGAIAYFGDQTKNLDATSWGIVLASGALALLSIILFYSNKSGSSLVGSSHFGIGFYLAALAAIIVVGSAYLFRSPTDSIKDSFNTIKKNIESKTANSESQTAPPPAPGGINTETNKTDA